MHMEHHKGLYIHYIKYTNWMLPCCSHMKIWCHILEHISEAMTVHGTQILPWSAGLLNGQLSRMADFMWSHKKMCGSMRSWEWYNIVLVVWESSYSPWHHPESTCGVASMSLLLWGLFSGWQFNRRPALWQPYLDAVALMSWLRSYFHRDGAVPHTIIFLLQNWILNLIIF
jgi:hypothetical protein